MARSATDYWTEFWARYGAEARSSDLQSQVLRVRHQRPIDEDVWRLTLEQVVGDLALAPQMRVLDLCSGNGLIAEEMIRRGAVVTALDISPDLLENLKRRCPGAQCIVADVRAAEFPDHSFDRILMYSAIQYLDMPEVVDLFERAHRWLAPGGRFHVADIPERSKLWVYFNTPERVQAHFRSVKAREPLIGTWFDPAYLERLAEATGYSDAQYRPQDTRLLYSDFRCDMVFVK